ncbi:MAG: LysM peptidoglycan-binding domain-containing protein, partial [Chloroflexi bacterium]|nr:LysM peptidoglycan-binding domain-containing protein [Chloroflexota bacterium]
GPKTQIWHVSAGDRLDTIAAKIYGDATKWRIIATRNQITDPLQLYPGQQLTIPSIWEI